MAVIIRLSDSRTCRGLKVLIASHTYKSDVFFNTSLPHSQTQRGSPCLCMNLISVTWRSRCFVTLCHMERLGTVWERFGKIAGASRDTWQLIGWNTRLSECAVVHQAVILRKDHQYLWLWKLLWCCSLDSLKTFVTDSNDSPHRYYTFPPQ